MPASESSSSTSFPESGSFPDSGMRAVPWVALRQRLEEAQLLRRVVEGPEAPPPETIVLHHLADDSRRVQAGGLFAAIRGTSADGHSFIDKAIQNGARIVICEA